MTKKKKNINKLKKHTPPDLIIRLFKPVSDENRWISYDIENLKLELMFIDDWWVASGTLDDEDNYYGYELTEVSSNHLVALTLLLSWIGLPSLLGLCDDVKSTMYDFYPRIEFHWVKESKRESILPYHGVLDITFTERNDGSWIWISRMCIIEAIYFDNVWVFSCDPRFKFKDEVNLRYKLTVQNENRERALHLLLNHPDIAFIFGFSKNTGVLLKNFFEKTRVKWQKRKQQIKRDYIRQSPPKTKVQSNIFEQYKPCPWKTVALECDDSYDCAFCSSSGTAYFMRWDD